MNFTAMKCKQDNLEWHHCSFLFPCSFPEISSVAFMSTGWGCACSLGAPAAGEISLFQPDLAQRESWSRLGEVKDTFHSNFGSFFGISVIFGCCRKETQAPAQRRFAVVGGHVLLCSRDNSACSQLAVKKYIHTQEIQK